MSTARRWRRLATIRPISRCRARLAGCRLTGGRTCTDAAGTELPGSARPAYALKAQVKPTVTAQA